MMRFLIVISFLATVLQLTAQDTNLVTLQIPRSSLAYRVCLADYASPIDYSYAQPELSYDLHSCVLPIRKNYVVFGENNDRYTMCRAFDVKPTSESYAVLDSAGNFGYRASAGISLRFQRDKWYNRTQVLTGWSSRESVDQDHPAFSPNHNFGYYWYNSVRTRTHYVPNETFDLSFGIDNHFFGEGYRSMVQANQAAPVPFAMMRVNFWRLEYGLLYQFNHDNNPGLKQIWKFNALHYLSYNITKRFNVTLMEQVLFQPTDGEFNRGFELEYLNPIVFFRPQEYSLGSTDNVLLGLNTSYKFKDHTVYGQICLDEFVIDEIRKRSKWWANKYGAQLGMKGTFKALKYIVEGNLVRPYMYSHINSGQNSGNMGLPVGHPLGSNFAEILAIVTKEKIKMAEKVWAHKFSYSAFAQFRLKGEDPDSLSWGGNIYESYVSRPKEYGNTIGQGLTIRNILVGAQFSYSNMKYPMEYYVQTGVNYTWGETKTRISPTVVVGVRSTLFGTRRFF